RRRRSTAGRRRGGPSRKSSGSRAPGGPPARARPASGACPGRAELAPLPPLITLSPMLALIQRVTHASVSVDGQAVGAIGPGLLGLVGIEPGDGEAQVERMATRLLGYRVFADDAGRMNRS